MVRIQEIQEGLLHLIGWRQSYDANDGVISEALTQSESGLYYQDVHALLTLQNLQSIAPDFSNIQYPEHSTEEAYAKGVVVTDSDKHYKSLKVVPENIQITDTEYWIETNPFSEWLETKTKACITKAINCYVNEKIAKGVTTKINRFGLQFSEPGDYTILVMHSSLMEPFYQETFTKRVGNNIEWFTPSQELYLPYETDEIDAGGSWYICYLQSQLPAESQAIRKSRDWSKGPCNECSRHEYETWRIWSRYIEIHPFYVNEEFVPVVDEQVQLWDVENNIYDYSTNYGLNLDITVACDITDFIIEQKMMFTDYLGKSLAVDFLREFAYNPNVRTNRHSINASRPDILYEIDGDSSSMKKSGMSYQLELASKAIQVSTEGMDRVCLPCVNHGIKYRTV